MTPIRETIARAVERYMRLPEEADEIWDEVLRALDEAGLAVVPREPTEAMQVAGAAISHDLSGQIGRPTDRHPVTAETYRAMISASVVE